MSIFSLNDIYVVFVQWQVNHIDCFLESYIYLLFYYFFESVQPLLTTFTIKDYHKEIISSHLRIIKKW